MLRKLLKYDLKFVYRDVSVFYILMFASTIIGRLLFEFDDLLILTVIRHIFLGFSISMMFSILINSAMRIWVRTRESVYKDQSYLTHTLPVSKKDIYLAKAITSAVIVFTSILSILIAVGIWFWKDTTVFYIEGIFKNTNNFGEICLLLLLLVFLEFVFIVLVGLLGVIVGHKFNNKKVLLSIISAFVIYGIFNLFSLGILGIGSLFIDEIRNLFITNIPPAIESFNGIVIFACILYLMYIIACMIASVKLLKKGVNVD